MILEWLLLLVFPALMIFAGAYDLFTMTIPNKISLALLAAFACLAPFAGLGLEGIGLHVAVSVAMLALTIGMFAMGWIGGGDAKIFAAAALWMGPAHIFDYAIAAALCGGALTIVILVLRRLPLPPVLVRQSWLSRLHDAGHGVPYGIALSAAAVIIYPHTIWLQAAS